MTGSAGTDSLGAFLAAQRVVSDRAIGRALNHIPPGSSVAEAIRYALGGGGKRLRPALCAACYEAVAGSPAGGLVADLGCAVELIHTYSLVHDDLPCMDNDDMRRSRPTVHRVFGYEVAAVAGVALIPLAFKVADLAACGLGLDAAGHRAIARTLAGAAGAAGMVGGQVMDLEGESASPDLEQLERTHAAKTAALLSAACSIGALAARASEPQLHAVQVFGRHLGLAFQITDDVLDETASTEQLGKTAGKDRSLAKATFPALMGVAAAAERAVTEASAAVAALQAAGLASETLLALGRFAVERKH